MEDTRIAAVVSKSCLGDRIGNLERISRWAAKAVNVGASIVCFPEMQVTGYHINSAVRNYAEPVPGPSTSFLEDLCSTHKLTILAGLAEKAADGRIYAAHLMVGPEGLEGVYRKVHLGPPEQEVYSAGSSAPVFKSCSLCFGIQLCYDAHFPEISTAMALRGADAVFIPHASPGGKPDEKLGSWMRHLPARAFDNSMFIIACNQTGDNGAGLAFPGAGLVLGPSGSVIASYEGAEEHMLTADLKAADLDYSRSHRMRYFLPNRRPDLYMSWGLESSDG